MGCGRVVALFGLLLACSPLQHPAPESEDGDWVVVGEALGCQALRLRSPKAEWLTWTPCAQGGSCEEVELGAPEGEFVYDVRLSRRGTPRLLIRTEYHLWVVDAWGNLVDGLAFAPCRPTGMDARGDRVLSLFQMAGGDQQGVTWLDIGGASGSVNVFPFDWAPAAQPVLGTERFLYPEQTEPRRMLSVALPDVTDVREVGKAGIFPPIDADDSFLMLESTDMYQVVSRTDGTAPAAPYFAFSNDSVCWVQRSYDSLVWSTCQYTPGASDRVFRTSFAAPSEASSVLLLEQPQVGFGIAAEGWYVSATEPVAVRVDDGKAHALEATAGSLAGVSAAHVYRYSETWQTGGVDYHHRIYRVNLP